MVPFRLIKLVTLSLAMTMVIGAMISSPVSSTGWRAAVEAGAMASAPTHSGQDGWDVPTDVAKMKNPIKATPESIQKGKQLYEANCAFCHGQTGKGDGPVASSLPEKPADLSNKEIMARLTDGEVFWRITKGKRPMPSFEKTLSEKERWHIVNYLRTLAR